MEHDRGQSNKRIHFLWIGTMGVNEVLGKQHGGIAIQTLKFKRMVENLETSINLNRSQINWINYG